MLACLVASLALFGPKVTLPQRGATYRGHVKVPVVGTQHISLHVLSARRARIQLTGLVDFVDTVTYDIDHTDLSVSFDVSKDLARLLSRYTCAITAARYDPGRDSAFVTFSIRAIRLRRIVELERQRACDDL